MNFDVKFSTNSQSFKTTLGTGEKSFRSGMQIDNTVGVPVVHDDHALLSNRDAADQHPMSAVTGLVEALAGKDTAGAAAGVQSALNVHRLDSVAHITAAERTEWNSKEASGTAASAVSAHNSSSTAHSDIRTALNGKETAGAAATVQSNLDAHTGDSTAHITAVERAAWNGKEDIGTAKTAVTAHNSDASAHSDIRDAIAEKISQSDLQSGIDTALAQAKASGEFDGKDGAQGIQGEKGADGKDGAQGEKGADGHTPVITAAKSGTVTTISADGTAIAEINDGEKGADGATGADGKTPVKGTDYWTEADKAEILSSIYPVGSVYISVAATDPATLFGGTWVKISAGRVLMGAADDSELGTTLDSGLPNITGTFSPRWHDKSGGGLIFPSTNGSGALYAMHDGSTSWFSGGTTSGQNAGWYNKIGFDASKSNSIYGASDIVQPPALKVNIWQRTA